MPAAPRSAPRDDEADPAASTDLSARVAAANAMSRVEAATPAGASAPCLTCMRLALARAVAMREGQVAEVAASDVEKDRHRREAH
ncbi:hypothetical protein [Streptomyces sp. NPDC002537]